MIFVQCEKTLKPKEVQPTIHSMNEDGTGIVYSSQQGKPIPLEDTYSLDYKFGDTGHFRNLLTVSSEELIGRTISLINYQFFNDDFNDSEKYKNQDDIDYVMNEFKEQAKRVVMGMGTGLIKPNRLNYLSKKWSEFDTYYGCRTPEDNERVSNYWKKMIKKVLKKPNHHYSDVIRSYMCVFLFVELLMKYKMDEKGNPKPSCPGLYGNNTMTVIDYPSEYKDIDFHKKETMGIGLHKQDDSKPMTEQEWLDFCGGSLDIQWTNLDMRRVS